MSAENASRNSFDDVLRASLRRHRERTPADFTERMLQQAREAEARKILAQIVWRQRLALAASILLGAAAIVGVVLFPGRIAGLLNRIGAGLSGYRAVLTDMIRPAAEIAGSQWQFYIVLAVVFGFALYCLVGLWLGDRVRMM